MDHHGLTLCFDVARRLTLDGRSRPTAPDSLYNSDQHWVRHAQRTEHSGDVQRRSNGLAKREPGQHHGTRDTHHPTEHTNLAPGTYTAEATIRSTVAGVAESKVAVTYVVTAAPQPQIGLSTSAVSFSAVQGQTIPGAQQVRMTNIGSGTLSGLSGIVTYGPGASGWLTASLNSTTAPATLTVQPNTTSLAPGTYTATVTIRSTVSGVAEKTVLVTRVVSAVPSAPAIIFVSNRDGDDEIYAMNPDGTGLRQLTTNSAASDTDPAWSRGGTEIGFSSDRTGNFDIYVMNPDGTGVVSQTPNSARRDVEPTWSPDGTRIAFARDRDGDFDIYVINVDGTGLRQLTNNTAFEGVPNWSPDGSKIVFASDRDGDLEIFVMNAEGAGQTQLTNNSLIDFHPRWSPDGRKIVLQSYRGVGSTSHIVVMNADGSGQAQLNEGLWDDLNPTWSPDGVGPGAWGRFGDPANHRGHVHDRGMRTHTGARSRADANRFAYKGTTRAQGRDETRSAALLGAVGADTRNGGNHEPRNHLQPQLAPGLPVCVGRVGSLRSVLAG